MKASQVSILTLFLVINCFSCSNNNLSFVSSFSSIESVSVSPEKAIQITTEKDGGSVAFMNETIQGYMNLPTSESLTYLKENNYTALSKATDFQDTRIIWSGGEGPYTVKLSTSQDLSDAITRTTENKYCYPGTLYPETKYYFQVTDSQNNESDLCSFVTGSGPRIINVREKLTSNGVNNVRDLGGWKTAEGKQIRFDRVFRGGMLVSSSYAAYEMQDHDKQILHELGIKTEIDFRKDSELGGQTKGALEGWNYYHLPFLPYNAIFPKEKNPDFPVHDAMAKTVIKQVFELMAEEKNYPFYIHCHAGMDRTGTVAYLINGLLGVSEDDLTRDYELTAFSKVCNMYRGTTFWYTYTDALGNGKYYSEADTWNKFTANMKAFYSREEETLSTAVRNYLITECDLSSSTLDKVIELMTE